MVAPFGSPRRSSATRSRWRINSISAKRNSSRFVRYSSGSLGRFVCRKVPLIISCTIGHLSFGHSDGKQTAEERAIPLQRHSQILRRHAVTPIPIALHLESLLTENLAYPFDHSS